MLIRRLIPLVALATACSSKNSIPEPVPLRVTEVERGFSATWDAVIDYFADGNITIATMDRASGFIAAAPALVGRPDGKVFASCMDHSRAKPSDHAFYAEPATQAVYNIVVRGDSAKSTVRATVRYSSPNFRECPSRGIWEDQFQKAIKGRAENR